MNLCIFCGRLTGDPEVRYSTNANAIAVASFTLAVNRRFKREGQPEADFIKCVSLGKPAENIEKMVFKGSKLIVMGEIQNDNYEKDGVKHYGMKLVVSQWEFAESKKAAASGGEAPAKAPAEDGGFMPIPTNLDMEMPFA